MDANKIAQEILRVAGNPTSGSLPGLAPEMAEAIVAMLNPPATRGKQTRVVNPPELRDTLTEEWQPADDK